MVTRDGIVKPGEAGGWSGIFLCVVSGPFHVVSLHRLVWASSQNDCLRQLIADMEAYVKTEGVQSECQ